MDVTHIFDQGSTALVYYSNGTVGLAYQSSGGLWVIGESDEGGGIGANFIYPFDFDHATSEYGWRTDPFDSGKQVFHSGIDGSTSAGVGNGANVIAAGAGTVIAAGSGTHPSWGNAVIIDHGGGLRTGYAHMQNGSITVSAGDPVSQGEVIGLVGSTGLSTGAHLHFTTWVNGSTVNPRNFMVTYA